MLKALNGNVIIDYLNSSAVLSSGQGTAGKGGNIRIEAADRIAINSVNTSSSGPGRGGNLELMGSQVELPTRSDSVQINLGDFILEPTTSSTNVFLSSSNDVPGNLTLTSEEIGFLNSNFESITIGRSDGTGTVFMDNMTYSAPLTVRSPDGSIVINGAIVVNNNAALTLEGPTILNGNITADSAPITIIGNTTLGSNPITLTSQDGTITLEGSINGEPSLTLEAGSGNINITGVIGGVTPVGNVMANSTGTTRFGDSITAASLTTNAGGTTELNGNVTTTGAIGQVYGDRVTTSANVTLSTVNSANGSIVINGGIEADTNASLTLEGSTILKGDITTSNAPLTITGDLTLDSNPITLMSKDGTITVEGSINGEPSLTLEAGSGNINITGVMGGVTPMGNLTVNTTGTTRFGDSITAASLTTNAGGTTEL
ncbi:MAG TPA: hypothetical protein V6D27_05945, partial [Vampirovibrionales bacterium]